MGQETLNIALTSVAMAKVKSINGTKMKFFDAVTTGSSLTLTLSCGGSGSKAYGYTATAQTLVLFEDSGITIPSADGGTLSIIKASEYTKQ